MAERTEQRPDPDARLRAALEPSEAQVGRVVTGALGGRRVRRPGLRLVAILSAAAVALVVLGGLLLLAIRPGAGSGPETGSEPPAAVVAARYSLTNRDGLLVVRSPDGGASFLQSRERPDEPPRGMVLIVRGGNRP